MAESPAPAPLPHTGENNANELIRSLVAVTSLSFVFMSLRFFCKLRYAKGFGIDDGLVTLAWACLVASITLECLSTQYGMGMHIFEIVDFAALPQANKFLFVGEFFGIIGISLAKTSFCVTLLRLATKRWHKILIWACIVTVNGFMWPCAITFFVGCTPLEKKWDPTVEGTCVDNAPIVNFAVFAGVWSALTDFVLAAFPWFLVWNLQMRRVERIGVCICMSMGVLSGIFALVKSAYLPPSLSDYTYKSTPLLIWSASELSIVILASSIPFLRLFWKEIHAKTSSRSRSKSAGYANGGGTYKMNTYAKMGSGTTPAASGNRTQVRAERMPDKNRDDDDSDKSILAQSKYVPHIMRTDEITVETRSAKDAESQRGYEVV